MKRAPQLGVGAAAARASTDGASQPSLLWFTGLLLGLLLVGSFLKIFHMFDFRVFYDAANGIVHGKDIYPTRAQLHARTRNYYVYPPLLAFVYVPLAQLPFVAASVLYVAILIGALGASLWLLGVRDLRCYIVLAAWMPVLQSIGLGSVEPLLVLGLALAWRYRDRAWAGTVPLAFAIAAKLLIWPLLLWLLFTGRWRRLAEASIATLAAIFVPWAAIGLRGLSWYPQMLNLLVKDEQPTSWSLPFHGTFAPTSLVADLAAAAAIGAVARAADGDRRAFNAAIAASLVLSPLVWLHYLLLLVVPIAVTSRRFSWLWALPLLAWWPYADSHRLLVVKIWVDAVVVLVALLTTRGPGARSRRPRHASEAGAAIDAEPATGL